MQAVQTLAPNAAAVAAGLPVPTVPGDYGGAFTSSFAPGGTSLEPGFFAPGGEGDPSPVSQEKLPAWAIPAGIGAAGLLFVLMKKKGR